MDKKSILVLGDSHAECFNSKVWRDRHNNYNWMTSIVHGATLSGLSNPNSTTGANEIFRDSLSTKKADTVILLLGEVDCGFVIWFYSQRDAIDPYIAADKAIENYRKFILLASAHSPVFVISAPLPTIGDNEVHGNVAQKRSSIKISQVERTKLTKYFNKQIKLFCVNNDISYVDMDSVSCGSDGMVHPSLLNKNISDHHYNKRSYMGLLSTMLMPILNASQYPSYNTSFRFEDLREISEVEIDLFRDCAVALEKINIHYSLKLMTIANRLRPNGPFIKKKLDKYNLLLDKLDL